MIIYSSTISALERAGEWLKGMEILLEMRESSVKSGLARRLPVFLQVSPVLWLYESQIVIFCYRTMRGL